MKEKRIKRKWQRLLMVVAMLFTLAMGISAQQVSLTAMKIDFKDGKWALTLKSPNSQELKSSEMEFEGKTKKLGICFFISKSQGQIENSLDDKGSATFANPSMTWNDQPDNNTGEWEFTNDNSYTFEFIATGGMAKNNNGGSFYDYLIAGKTYYLNIKIQDNNDNNKIKNAIATTWAHAMFKYEGNGVISNIKKISGFEQNDDMGNIIQPGSIQHLEKNKTYVFLDKNVTNLWRDAKNSSDKIYTFGWFDERGKFLGVSGYYEIKDPTETGRNYEGKYYDIIPVYSNEGTKEYKHLQYATDGNSLDLSDGALYLGGSKDGFGIPEANHEWGWDGDEGKDDNGKKANQEIKGSAVPQIEKGKYQFEITTGTQINAWGDDGLPLLCKLYHYKQWSHPIDGSDQRYPGYEFKRWHEGVQIESKDAPNGHHKYTFYHVEKNTEASPLGGMFEVTQSQRADRGDGNIHGITIGQDSYLPKFPNGYTFRFTLDLNNNTEIDRLDFPLQVILAGRPDNVDGDDWYAKDGEMPDLEKNRTGYVGDITVNLNDKDGKKRIWLRDAFRLDWNIPYASSNPKAAEEDKPMKINRLTVRGELNIDDLYYLGDLVEEGKIKEIDLSKAIIEGGQIPATFAQNPDPEHENSELTSISLPANTSIGAYAFTNCTGLEEVTFAEGDNTKVMVGAGAFKGCTKLTNKTVQDIINHTNTAIMTSVFEGIENVKDIIIPSDITLINEKAFANTGLKKLTLPATCNGKNVEPQATKNWIKPGRIGDVFVKKAYNDYNDYKGDDFKNAAREARTIKSGKDLEIDARDFNLEQASGWFNNGDHEAAGTFDESWRPDIKKNNVGFCIYNTGTESKLGNLQAFYWFNYSFLVEEEGDYNITAYMANDDDGGRYPEFTIDGGNEAITIHVNTHDWKPNDHPHPVGNVHLKPGIHYITFHAASGSDLSKIVIGHGKSKDEDIQEFKVGPNQGQVITEYNLIDKEGTKSILSSHEKAFDGVTPNDCEVVFSDNTSDEMIKGYRNEGTGAYAVDNSGLKMLLTKDLDEAKAYKNVNQYHADAKHTHKFESNAWYSIVLPFDINAKLLVSVKNSDDNSAFDKAARYKYNDFSGIYIDPENGEKTTGLPKAHFIYLDNEVYLKDAKDEEIIRAGEPFLIHCANASSDDIYTFKDVHTLQSETSTIANETEMTVKPNGGISFIGNLYAAPRQLGTSEWFVSNYYYHSNNAKLKPYRAWLSPETEAAAKGLSLMFNNDDDDSIITGISIINTEKDEVNTGIYNLNGQKVRKNSNNTKDLPNGIYIVNGKRIIIK